MADIHYVRGKLHEALNVLTVHPGRIHERLIEASHQALHAISKDQSFDAPGVPEDAVTYWLKIHEAITSQPSDGRRGVFIPSIEKLTDEEAREVAQMVESLASMLDVAE